MSLEKTVSNQPIHVWILAMTVCVMAVGSPADAHPGGVDKAGGHVDKKTGLYHFHRIDGRSVDPATNIPKNAGEMIPSSKLSPEQKQRLAREHAAEALFKAALKAKRKETALRTLASLFPETRAGARAKRAADRLAKANGTTQPEPTDAQLAERRATARLDVARRLFAIKEDELAVEILEQLAAKFPKTKAAASAKEMITGSEAPEEIDLPDGGFFDSKLKNTDRE